MHVLAFDHEDRPDQVVYRQRIFGDQTPGPIITPVAPQTGPGITAGKRQGVSAHFRCSSGQILDLDLREGLLQVGQDVVDMLNAQGQSHIAGSDASGQLGFGVKLGVGG